MELKDVTEFLGVEAKDLAEFKAKINAKFITRKEALDDDEISEALKSKITGKVSGTINTLAKRFGKLTNEDLEGKKYEEVIELMANKLNTEIAGLKEASTKGSDEKVKELEEKLGKISTTLQEEKEAKALLKKTLEDKETEWGGKFKDIKKNTVLSGAKDKITPKLIEMSEEQRFFLDNKISELYNIDFDEKEQPFVTDKAGKRIPNPNKAGDFLGLEDAILKIAEEKNYVKKNSGGTVAQEIFTKKEPEIQNAQQPTKRVHPNAVKHAEELKTVI